MSDENPIVRQRPSRKRVPGRGEKKRPDGGRTAGTAVAIAVRRLEAMRMRVAGKTLQQIADALGVSLAVAWQDIEAVLESARCEAAATAVKLRQIEVARLDALWDALYERAVTDRDEKAIDRLIRLSERRSKLLGLDAPARSEVSGPDGGAIAVDARTQLIERLASLAGVSQSSSPEDAGEPDTD